MRQIDSIHDYETGSLYFNAFSKETILVLSKNISDNDKLSVKYIFFKDNRTINYYTKTYNSELELKVYHIFKIGENKNDAAEC